MLILWLSYISFFAVEFNSFVASLYSDTQSEVCDLIKIQAEGYVKIYVKDGERSFVSVKNGEIDERSTIYQLNDIWVEDYGNTMKPIGSSICSYEVMDGRDINCIEKRGAIYSEHIPSVISGRFDSLRDCIDRAVINEYERREFNLVLKPKTMVFDGASCYLYYGEHTVVDGNLNYCQFESFYLPVKPLSSARNVTFRETRNFIDCRNIILDTNLAFEHIAGHQLIISYNKSNRMCTGSYGKLRFALHNDWQTALISPILRPSTPIAFTKPECVLLYKVFPADHIFGAYSLYVPSEETDGFVYRQIDYKGDFMNRVIYHIQSKGKCWDDGCLIRATQGYRWYFSHDDMKIDRIPLFHDIYGFPRFIGNEDIGCRSTVSVEPLSMGATTRKLSVLDVQRQYVSGSFPAMHYFNGFIEGMHERIKVDDCAKRLLHSDAVFAQIEPQCNRFYDVQSISTEAGNRIAVLENIIMTPFLVYISEEDSIVKPKLFIYIRDNLYGRGVFRQLETNGTFKDLYIWYSDRWVMDEKSVFTSHTKLPRYTLDSQAIFLEGQIVGSYRFFHHEYALFMCDEVNMELIVPELIELAGSYDDLQHCSTAAHILYDVIAVTFKKFGCWYVLRGTAVSYGNIREDVSSCIYKRIYIPGRGAFPASPIRFINNMEDCLIRANRQKNIRQITYDSVNKECYTFDHIVPVLYEDNSISVILQPLSNSCIGIDCGRGRCVNTQSAYSCLCDPGFSFYGLRCEDIDECETGYRVCGDYGLCVNYEGGYECHCNEGYQLIDLMCQKIPDDSPSDGSAPSESRLTVVTIVLSCVGLFTIFIGLMVTHMLRTKTEDKYETESDVASCDSKLEGISSKEIHKGDMAGVYCGINFEFSNDAVSFKR